MYKIAICDDDRDFLELAESMVQRYCEEHEIIVCLKSFQSSDMLTEAVENNNLFDVYLLDIEMKRYSGIEIAGLIKEHSARPLILFWTAYSQYAVKACCLDIFWYLCKEDGQEGLWEALDKAFIRLSQYDDRVYIINNKYISIKIPYAEIIYIYKDKKNVVFVLNRSRKIQERTTLQNVYETMKSEEMIYADRGTIVNLEHLRKITEGKIVMDEGYAISSNTQHISEIKRHFHDYWRNTI